VRIQDSIVLEKIDSPELSLMRNWLMYGELTPNMVEVLPKICEYIGGHVEPYLEKKLGQGLFCGWDLHGDYSSCLYSCFGLGPGPGPWVHDD
jgi:hypothetical protein